MSKTYFVYHLRDPIDNYPFYVGKGQDGRLREHLRKAKYDPEKGNKHKNYKILQILNAGREIDFRIVFKTDDEDEAYEKEIKEIAYWREILGDKLTNISPGGNGSLGGESHPMYGKPAYNRGKSPSNETRKRMSIAAKKRCENGSPRKGVPLPEETKRKISISCKRAAKENPNYGRRGKKMPEGWINPLKGRTRPSEVGQNISRAKKGKPCPTKGIKRGPMSEEAKRNMSKAQKGRKQSKETKQKISKAKTELYKNKTKIHWIGKKHTEETKQKMSESRNKYWETEAGKERKKAIKIEKRGENATNSKLRDLDIPVIRRLRKDTELSMKQIGNMFSVSDGTIHSVVNYKTWKHIK